MADTQNNLADQSNVPAASPAAATPTPVPAPPQASTGGSSPWDEPLDVPGENPAPKVIGNLAGDVHYAGTPEPFKLPVEDSNDAGQTGVPLTPATPPTPDATAANDSAATASPVTLPPNPPADSNVPNIVPVTPPPILSSDVPAAMPDTNIADIPMADDPTPAASPDVSATPSLPANPTAQPAATATPGLGGDLFGKSAAPSGVGALISPAPTTEVPKDTTIKDDKTEDQTEKTDAKPISPVEPKVETPVLATPLASPTPIANPTAPAAPVSPDQKPKKSLKIFESWKNLQPKKRLMFILLIVFVLVVLPLATISTLVYLTENGKVSLGLENIYDKYGLQKLWGGLGIDGGTSLLQSYSAMKAQTDYKITGSIAMTVDKTTGSSIVAPILKANPTSTTSMISPTKIILAAATTTNTTTNTATGTTAASTGSTSSDIFSTTSPSNYLALSCDVKAAMSTDGNDVNLNFSGENQKALEIRQSLDKLWVNSSNVTFASNQTNDSWLEYTLPTKLGSSVFFAENADKSGLSVNGARVATEKLNGEQVYHYQFDSIDIGDSLKSFGIEGDMVQNITGDIWLGVKDHLIKQVDFTMDMAASYPIIKMEVKFNFSDYGVKNTFAEPAKIVQPTVVVAAGSTDSVAAQTAAKNDAQRRIDLSAVKAAFVKYMKANSSYPLAATEIKLNTAANVVEQALVPTYLAALPKDPKDAAGWSYGYKSDGHGFTLSARLESPDLASPGSTPTIYYLSDK
ncbi:MAG: hypothetical protein NTW50_00330 [Candidatus Berkelbacteria bacterium]|nr:hypothetical protein [Candidatus Berkelbacteria bacterium]